jgi:hypothetical protein
MQGEAAVAWSGGREEPGFRVQTEDAD